MSDKVMLVTGSNNGIGFETAKALTAQGVHVVMLCRSKERGEAARRKIEAETGRLPDLLLADLSLQAEIQRVSAEYRARYERLDALVNVAGYSWNERDVTSEGFERTFALNYLAYFRLTLELLPLLVRSAPSRVVNIASSAHRWRDIALDNLQGEREWPKRWPMPIMYGWSNMMRIMFTYELAERLDPFGVTANALCPGFVPVKRSTMSPWLNALSGLMQRMPNTRTPAQAAETIIWLANGADSAELTGAYFESGEQVESAPQTYDREVRRALWQRTLDLIGVVPDPTQALSGVVSAE